MLCILTNELKIFIIIIIIGIKFPTPYAWESNSPPLGRLKWSNAQGMPWGGGGEGLKLRFERYIRCFLKKIVIIEFYRQIKLSDQDDYRVLLTYWLSF